MKTLDIILKNGITNASAASGGMMYPLSSDIGIANMLELNFDEFNTQQK